MSDIDVKFLTDSKRISACKDLSLWTLEELSKKLIGMVSPRSTQLMCSEDSKLKPPLIQALSTIFCKPEYQFLAEIPKTYIFNGRYINDGRLFANVLQQNQIIDIRWNEAQIDDVGSFDNLLSLIDSSNIKTGPLSSKPDTETEVKVSFREKYKSFELSKLAFDDFCFQNKVQVWGIPVFKVFKISPDDYSAEQSTFVWKTGVIIEFYKYQESVNSGGKVIFPTYADTVGEERFYTNNQYFGNEPEQEKRALDCRQDLLADGNVNFGSLEIDKILYDRSTATVARANSGTKPQEE
tara:strand:- start:98 stop:982 length:885 start_codon:yes stop_codon:yes gene_type:complete